jgi:sigma-B regulation protein RsbU (phosphoserine phosphatase)
MTAASTEAPMSATPLYRVVEEHLRARIGSGELVPGDLIPSESQLGDQMQRAGHAQYNHDLSRILRAGETLLAMITRNIVGGRVAVIGDIDDLATTIAATPDLAAATMPADPQPVAELSNAGDVADHAAGKGVTGRILVVDDSEENREVLRRQLERDGHKVATASDGRKAIGLLKSESFDLVLLDMLMPELDGHGTLIEIKADPALAHLPVIMVSALGELASVVRRPRCSAPRPLG